MSEVLERTQAYLRRSFPEHAMSEEWDRSRNVLVVRLERNAGERTETLLVELAAALVETGDAERVDGLFEAQDLASLLRKSYRVLVSSDTITPLPWKQLAPEVSSVDEVSRESFPASDPAPLSSLTRDAPSKGRAR